MSFFIHKNILHYYVDLMRGRSDCVNSLHNVIRTMSATRHCICQEDLQNLNFGNIPLNNIQFSNTDFSESTISESNLMSGFTCPITDISYTHDGNSIVASSEDEHSAIILDIETGVIKSKIPIHEGTLILSADGTKCLAEDSNGDVVVYNIETRKRNILKKHIFSITPIGFSASEKVILTCTKHRAFNNIRYKYPAMIQLWLTETGKLLKNIKLTPFDDKIFIAAAKISPDNKRCVVFLSNGIFLVIDTETGNTIYEHKYDNLNDIEIESVSLSSDAKICILHFTFREDVLLINTETGELLHKLEYENINSLAISFDGKYCIIGIIDKPYILIDVKSGEEIYVLKRNAKIHSSIAFPPKRNSDTCVISSFNQILVYNVNNGEVIKQFGGHTAPIEQLTFIDNRALLTSSINSVISIWDTEKGMLTKKIQMYNESITTAIAFLSKRNAILAGYRDGTLALYNTETSKILRNTTEFYTPINSIAISQDEELCLVSTCFGEKTIIMFELNSLNVIRNFEDEKSGIAVAFSGDNKILIGSNSDRTATVYDVKTLKPLYKIDHKHYDTSEPSLGHVFRDRISVAKFSSDNRYLVTFAENGSVIMWNANNGNKIYELKSYKHGWTPNIAFSSDSKIVYTSSFDKAIFYDVYTGEIINKTKAFGIDIVISNDFSVMASRCGHIAEIFTQNGRKLYELYNITDLYLDGCDFRNVNANDKTKEILRQQGAITEDKKS